MNLLATIRIGASKTPKTILLPEGEDDRVIEAAKLLSENKIVRPVIVAGDALFDDIRDKVPEEIIVERIGDASEAKELAETYYQIRKHKGISSDDAYQAVRTSPVLSAFLMVRLGRADGIVAGASNTTPNILRYALHCLPRDEKAATISGAFLIEMTGLGAVYGENGVFMFADCGVNPKPNARQLSGIAISSARTFKQLVGKEPRVAFLSYSSKGSARGESVDTIREALTKTKEKDPSLIVDGELQLDSAIVPEVAKRKCPGSDVAGRANVLIFPNLDAGNIAYKMVQRLAGGRAVGPIIQGFERSCSDLSRGCSVDDIVDAAAITALQAQRSEATERMRC
ncbi:MAG: phosphate acetyltransferase [Candidatus Omnitrophota bacterium]